MKQKYYHWNSVKSSSKGVCLKFCLEQVKVDAKTKTLLDDWKGKKKSQEESKDDKEKNGDKDDKTEEGEMKDDKDELDEFTLREDRVAKAGLDAIMREYAFELAKEPVNSKPVGKWSSFLL